MNASSTYRWNAQEAAAAYDRAAPVIHPRYEPVQDALLDALPFTADDAFHAVDLGGGSGRLVERLLGRFPHATATVVDPSAPFLRLAADRLEAFAARVRLVAARAQEDWPGRCAPFDAIVSTSALHHLDAQEKNAVFRACFEALPNGGVLINGDEYRPPSDSAYRELLVEWGEHMESALAVGSIPESFREVIAKWRVRNLDRFGGPRHSGDDCHETVEEQAARLYGAGFSGVETVWRDRLWAVVKGVV